MNNQIHFLTLAITILFFTSSLSAQTFEWQCEGGLNPNDNKIQLRWAVVGTDWNCRFLTYYFVNGTSDVSGEQAAVEDAMKSWSAVTNIDFIEACNAGDAVIRISW